MPGAPRGMPRSMSAPRQHSLRRLATWVGVVVALSLVGLTLTRLLVPRELLARTADPAGDYLQTLGTIYAVLQAFVVFVVWTQFNEARSFVEREANEIMDLFRTTQAL